ncbi:hypothetical protein ACFPJ1_19945 [Kribbella qitaiheensis]|uniref:hypothetical protein n=1 Tax=Kribbella qitaiheensis TaxID=1544730 RepID=UPI0036086B62
MSSGTDGQGSPYEEGLRWSGRSEQLFTSTVNARSPLPQLDSGATQLDSGATQLEYGAAQLACGPLSSNAAKWTIEQPAKWTS